MTGWPSHRRLHSAIGMIPTVEAEHHHRVRTRHPSGTGYGSPRASDESGRDSFRKTLDRRRQAPPSIICADGATVIQWSPTGATNQQWQFRAAPTAGYVNIVNRSSGKCLDVNQASTSDMAPIIQWACGSGPNQEWEVVLSGSFIQLKARHSGTCLDVPGQSTALGTQLVQYTCNSGPNQQFTRS